MGGDSAYNRLKEERERKKSEIPYGRNWRSFRLLTVRTPDLKQIVTNKRKEFIISSVSEGGGVGGLNTMSTLWRNKRKRSKVRDR